MSRKKRVREARDSGQNLKTMCVPPMLVMDRIYNSVGQKRSAIRNQTIFKDLKHYSLYSMFNVCQLLTFTCTYCTLYSPFCFALFFISELLDVPSKINKLFLLLTIHLCIHKINILRILFV